MGDSRRSCCTVLVRPASTSYSYCALHEGAAYWQQCVRGPEWISVGTYAAMKSLSQVAKTVSELYSSRPAVCSPVGAEFRQIMAARG
jgi:hypothetical protein